MEKGKILGWLFRYGFLFLFFTILMKLTYYIKVIIKHENVLLKVTWQELIILILIILFKFVALLPKLRNVIPDLCKQAYLFYVLFITLMLCGLETLFLLRENAYMFFCILNTVNKEYIYKGR